MNPQRQKLIDKNPCNIPDDCPDGIPTCGCSHCAESHGFWNDHERKQFSDAENKLIDSKWNKEKGYLGDNGCKLPRKLMPINCLSWTECEFKYEA